MLTEGTLPIDFGQGIDTKTDPKLVVSGKLLQLQNGTFTNIKRIAKRNGYGALGTAISSGGNIIAPTMVHGYNEELIIADQNLLLSYSPSQNAWINKGGFESTEVSRVSIDQEHPSNVFVSSAILGNYTLYGWSTIDQSNDSYPEMYGQVFASVVDMKSGTILLNAFQLTNNTSVHSEAIVKCIVLGTNLAIIYLNAQNGDVELRTVIFSGSGVVSLSSPIIVTTNYGSGTGAGAVFDIVETLTGASIFYTTTTGYSISNINFSGSVTANSNITDANQDKPISILRNTFNNNLWVYYTDFSSPNYTIKYSIYSPTLAVILAPTSIITSIYNVSNIIEVNVSASEQLLYYSLYTFDSNTINQTDVTHYVTVSSVGTVGVPVLFANGVAGFSKIFTIGVDEYAFFVYRGPNIAATPQSTGLPQIEPTLFLIKLTNIPVTGMPLVVARIASGLINTPSILRPSMTEAFDVSFVTATKILFAVAVEVQEFQSDFFQSIELYPAGISGVFGYTVDFSGPDSYIATNTSEIVTLNGGILNMYDSQFCVELGFNLFPEIISLTQSTTTDGMIANGEYSYLAIFQWIDGQGNLHQSAPSLAKTITTTGGNNTVTIEVTNNYLSQKINSNVAIYRTQNEGSTYYLVTDPVFVTNSDAVVNQVTMYADTLSDAQISGNPQSYTSPGSSVLENTTPPPSMIGLAHNNRFWFVDAENPNTIWYTKSFSPGTGISPSGFMIDQIDPKFNNISALAEMDDKLIILKKEGVIVQSGDGVTDTGTNLTLSFPQAVPSDVGCDQLKSVVTTPTGVMFHSDKGIYMINRSLGVTYAGMDVEQYNSQTITSAKLINGKSQIRFLAASGITIVYDYIFNQWSTFTNHLGVAADNWQGNYVYATTSGNIFEETPGSYTDNGTGFNLFVQTSWLALASVQGFQRVRRLIMLGDFINGASSAHQLEIQAAYDFNPALMFPLTCEFTNSSVVTGASSGPFQYRERLPRQKCDTISLTIQENNTGDPAEYIDLTNISFEAGVKKGVNKMPYAQSVG